ncbi:MAG: hypothetical protein IH621_08435 [Krumholzibacteria bacterium]|nr:hypothetical protein [Candidatus Krumholzibacteria bacterium]
MTKNLSKTDRVRGLGTGIVLLALAAALPASAAPQLMTDYGDQWAWRSGDINAMGGTGIALYRGGLSNLYNPAMLALETGTRLDAGLAVDQESEDRFVPLFDTFSSWVADASVAANRNHFWQSGFGAARRVLDGRVPLTAALSLTDRYPFEYGFEEEIRNPDPFNTGPQRDMIMETRSRELEGTLRNLSLGLGAAVHERVSVGFAAHYAFGTRTDTWAVRDFDTADGDSSYAQTYEQDVDGINVTFGLRGVVNERVEIGLAWESRLKASGDFSDVRTAAGTGTVVDETRAGHWKYPDIYRAGLAFRPRTDPATVFTIEFEYMPWSQTEDTEKPADLNAARMNDTMDVRVGVQHTFYNGVPVRFGFRHYDSYMDKEASASAFSGGVGLPFGDGLISVSLELTKLTGILDHQFPYSPDYWGDAYFADPEARVEDTRFRVGVGYTLNF